VNSILSKGYGHIVKHARRPHERSFAEIEMLSAALPITKQRTLYGSGHLTPGTHLLAVERMTTNYEITYDFGHGVHSAKQEGTGITTFGGLIHPDILAYCDLTGADLDKLSKYSNWRKDDSGRWVTIQSIEVRNIVIVKEA
jgi:hypothetical protein